MRAGMGSGCCIVKKYGRKTEREPLFESSFCMYFDWWPVQNRCLCPLDPNRTVFLYMYERPCMLDWFRVFVQIIPAYLF